MRIIVAYEAETIGNKVLIARFCQGAQDGILASSWEEASNFLMQQVGDGIHIVHNLSKFATVLFTLLPEEKRKELAKTPRIYHNNSKIFYIPSRLLGITNSYFLKGNTYELKENNFYQIQHWLSREQQPITLTEVARYGEQILQALETLGITTSKLTSPIAVYEDKLIQHNLPTIWSNDNDTFIDACNYCIPIMRNEWRQVLEAGLFDKVYTYDVVGAYPYFMSNLPNTDDCEVIFSDKFIVSDWGVMKGKLSLRTKNCPIQANQEYLTTEQLIWLYGHSAGEFEIENGYFFFQFNNQDKPFKSVIDNLFQLRQSNSNIASNIAKKIAQGLSGKLDQENLDGKLGDLYNPVLALMARSRCSLAVANFICEHNLWDSLIEVNVDSVTATKKLSIADSLEMGSWRLKEEK